LLRKFSGQAGQAKFSHGRRPRPGFPVHDGKKITAARRAPPCFLTTSFSFTSYFLF